MAKSRKRKTKRGRSARNARNAPGNQEPEDLIRAPHSFVIHRGKLGKNANELMLNFRKIMEPFTASQLKVQKQNVLKDFVHIAGPLNVSHLVVFTKSQMGTYLRIVKLPRGPTLTFQVEEYSLVRDIITSQKKPLVYEKLFNHHPLLVLNNFSGEGMQLKLMITMFQNMFPSINVDKTNLNTIRRCLLLNYNAEKSLELRHYAIKVVPTGMSKGVKKLIQSKVPDLSQYHDISEFLENPLNLSESEAELDSAINTVTLPQNISSRGNMTSQKSAIRLYELGPRLKMKLVKIEEGMMTGEVIFHEFVSRTPEEIKALKDRIKAKQLLKLQRRLTQEKNVQRKKEAVEEKDSEGGNSEQEDLEWYHKEVGEKPDADIAHGVKRKKQTYKDNPKRARLSHEAQNEKSSGAKSIQEVLAVRKKKKLAKAKMRNRNTKKQHRKS